MNDPLGPIGKCVFGPATTMSDFVPNATVSFSTQSDLDAIRRELADLAKRLHRSEATIERLLAEPRRSTPAELVNQTVPARKPLPPHYSLGKVSLVDERQIEDMVYERYAKYIEPAASDCIADVDPLGR